MADHELKRRFGLSASTLRFLKSAGLLRRSGDYDFCELLLLRTVGALRAAQLPTRTIQRALRHLKPWVSENHSSSHVSLQVIGEQVIVREGRLLWEPCSGQYALPLEFHRMEHILTMTKRKKTPNAIDTAHDHYLRGADLEEDDAVAALDGDCTHLNARINLGRLLHLQGKHREAESIYRDTKAPDAILFFNLGVLLEDRGRPSEATEAYRNALIHDPGLADAHYNLALVHERAGDTQAAFRHLLAYRRLSGIRRGKTRGSAADNRPFDV
jgi:tetratricopeptide (TPR) repeat protein